MDKISTTIDKLSNGESSKDADSGFVPLVAGGFIIGLISGIIFVKCVKKSINMAPKNKI